MKIDPRSHVPIYLQIADGIRAAVAAGRLPARRGPALAHGRWPSTSRSTPTRSSGRTTSWSARAWSTRSGARGLFVAEQGTTSAQARAQRRRPPRV